MKTTKANLVLILVALLISALAGASFGEEFFVKDGARAIEGQKWVPGELLVKFKRGVSEGVIRGINNSHGSLTLSISKRGQFRRLRIPKNKTVEEMVAIYSQNPNVEYAEQNFIASALMVPNDPYYSYQWHLDNPVYGGIHTQPAWDIETGDTSVIVAVIDTGVAYEDYEEFVDNPGRGKDYWITYQKAPDLANTNFVAGYDFVNNDEHSNDDEGHGTHVTGTIAQSTNNAIGAAGAAFGTSIMPVKVLDSKGSGTYADIADGIYFAADNGATVINLSLGGTSTSSTLENAISYAYNKGVTIVCAAGNEYESGNSPLYPAAYDTYCIAVGATTYDEARAYYSNTGSYLDIAAPGGDLYTDLNGDGYGDGVLQQTFGNSPTDWGYWFYQGTSMATPHVSAVAALLIANGITGPDNIRNVLETTAEDKGQQGWDPEYGWGIVDAYAALNYETEPVHDLAVLAIDAPSQAYEGDLVSVSVTVKNQGSYDEATIVSLTENGVAIDSQPVSLNAGDSTIVSFDWDTTGASIADHILKAEASTVSGETDIADNSLTTTVTINEVSTVTIYVDSIEMSLSTKKAGRNTFTKALATITILYTDGSAVEGATLYGSWSDATSDIDSGITDSFGKVTISSDEVKNASGGTTFTFTVDNVLKSGWTYDASANTITSKSITVP